MVRSIAYCSQKRERRTPLASHGGGGGKGLTCSGSRGPWGTPPHVTLQLVGNARTRGREAGGCLATLVSGSRATAQACSPSEAVGACLGAWGLPSRNFRTTTQQHIDV